MADIVNILASGIPLAIIFFTIMAMFITVAYLEYKKKMAMIEKGLIPEEEKEKHNRSPENKLAWGIAILGIGISLLINWKFNFGGEYTAGLIFISIGIGLLTSHFWKETRTNE